MPPELTPYLQPITAPLPPTTHQNHSGVTERSGGGGVEDETGGWYIPRPVLWRGELSGTCDRCSGGGGGSTSTVREWISPPSSNTSTQSGSSGSLLLTAANLAALRLEPVVSSTGGGVERVKDPDATSLASSTHFTIVNWPGVVREKRQSVCCKHHVSAIVLSMSAIFLLGLMAALYYIDMRNSVRYSR